MTYEGMLEEVRLRLRGSLVREKTIRLVVQTWRDVLLGSTKRDGRAHWPSVGVFVIARRKARRGFKIGMAAGSKESIEIPASWALALRASKETKGHGDGPT